jgi:hypothetical protein
VDVIIKLASYRLGNMADELCKNGKMERRAAEGGWLDYCILCGTIGVDYTTIW